MAELRAVDDYPLQECASCHYTWMSDDETCPRCVFEPEGFEPGRSLLIDWAEFWSRDPATEDWLIWPLVPAGRGVALFAPAKAGKSLVILALAAGGATGRRGLDGVKRDPISVLYLDYEMTLDDLQERLEAMGYGPESDLSNLHYASLPSLPPLNSPEGAKAVVELVKMTGAQLVVIDTFGRAVEGEENSNDVAQDFYRWTGLALKSAGVAYLRTDHAGKDPTKGQRGGSAKNDDVDVVWQLMRVQDGVIVKATHRRIGWVPESVHIQVDDTTGWDLSVTQDMSYPAGTKELAELMDSLKISVDESTTNAIRAIKAASPDGKGKQKGAILAAQRYRRSLEMDVLHPVPNGSAPGRNGAHHHLPGSEPVREPVGTAGTGSENRQTDTGNTDPVSTSGTAPRNTSSTRAGTGPEPPEPVVADKGDTGFLPLGGTGSQSQLDDDWEDPF
jgi:hypothetical protein